MNDEALTPFVDALSASLIIMILIAISFILQNAIAINQSAKEFVDVQIEGNDYNPVTFRPALKVDIDVRAILFLVNFDLDDVTKNKIREEIINYTALTVTIRTRQSDRQSTANIIRFINMMDLPQDIQVTTVIE